MKIKNWKTTIAGLAAAVAISLQPLVVGGEFKWYNVLLGIVVGLLGFVSKDFDKTGL